MAKTDFKSIDEYINTFPKDTQVVLESLRATIKKAAPDVTEAISYQIPTFKLNGKYLIYFAGFTKHVSIYPIFTGNEPFQKELAKYKSGKATARFPIDKPLPLSLITKIVKHRVKLNKVRYLSK